MVALHPADLRDRVQPVMNYMHIDLQRVCLGALIIALTLLIGQ